MHTQMGQFVAITFATEGPSHEFIQPMFKAVWAARIKMSCKGVIRLFVVTWVLSTAAVCNKARFDSTEEQPPPHDIKLVLWC